MDHQDYLAGIAELYAAEVLGEVLASRWLGLSSSADQKYKLEDAGQRATGVAVAERFASMPWKAAMADLAELAQSEATGEAAMDRALLPMLSYPWARNSGADS